LASVVTKILLSPGFSWSMVVRQSEERTSFLISSKAREWSRVHPGQDFSLCLLVKGLRIDVHLARSGKLPRYRTRPRNLRTSDADFGTGQLATRSTLDPSGRMPSFETTCPRNPTDSQKNLDFLPFR